MLDEVPPSRFSPADLPDGTPVPVLFYAEWCGYCARFLPSYAERARDASDRPFLQVDISDEESPLWDEHGVEVVPTVIVFQGGQEIARAEGPLRDVDLDRLLVKVGIDR